MDRTTRGRECNLRRADRVVGDDGVVILGSCLEPAMDSTSLATGRGPSSTVAAADSAAMLVAASAVVAVADSVVAASAAVVAAEVSTEEAQVGVGKTKPLTRREHQRISAAVAQAESFTGLQFCVYLGATHDEHPRAHAEALFTSANLHEHPAVLVVLSARQRRVEILTGRTVQDRVTNTAAVDAIATMTAAFARVGIADGLIIGIEYLAQSAGRGNPTAVSLPNTIDGA